MNKDELIYVKSTIEIMLRDGVFIDMETVYNVTTNSIKSLDKAINGGYSEKNKECPRCKGFGYVKDEPTRSLPLNKYYHSVVTPIISIETGDTKEETHELLKGKFNDYKSTTKLSNSDFMIYLEKIKSFAREYLNAHIPTPDNVTEEVINEIKRNYKSMFF